MQRNARHAAERLKKLGAPVYHQTGYQGAHFVIGAELRHRGDTLFADMYGDEICEEIIGQDEYRRRHGDTRWSYRVYKGDQFIVNAFGVREDVHRILKQHGLQAEWINAAMVGIYDA